jgi:hypothetical protein
MKKLLLLALMLNLLFACQKEAGEGGTSSIIGKVVTYEISHFDVPGTNQRVDTLGYYYQADEEVYIIYGDEDNYYDDSYETSFDGSFRFENLRKGKYSIFIYSDCESDTNGLAVISQSNPAYAQQLASTIWKSDCIDGEVAVRMEMEITENNEQYNLGDITRFKIESNQ